MTAFATALFSLAALVGVFMATRHFRKQTIPWLAPVAHGLFAASALIVLAIFLYLNEAAAVLWVAFSLFLMAAIGGFLILKSYLRKKPLPSALIIIHAMLVLMGFIFLVIYLYAQSVLE